MLWEFGIQVLEFLQGCLEIFWHGDVAGACSIVPVDGKSAEEGTGPVGGDGGEFLEGLDLTHYVQIGRASWVSKD